MEKKTLGILYTVLSAIIYGFTPILARMAFDGGANGITASFLRGLISLPFLGFTLKYRNIPLGLGKDRKQVVIVGIFGMALTTILLYMSYGYVSVGMATTVHFAYPILVTVACVFLFHEKMNFWKNAALVLCTLGILTFMERSGSSAIKGVLLALLSAATYAFYMVYIDKGNLRHIHYLKLTFYFNLLMSLVAGATGLYTGNLHLSLTPKAWILCALVSLFTSFGALPLLQLGIKYTGASTAAILSTLEPITSVILGILVLQEEMTFMKLVGCALIIVSILLIAKGEMRDIQTNEQG